MVESELVSVNYKVKMAKKKLRYKEKQPYFYGNGQKNNDESASIDRRVSNIESSQSNVSFSCYSSVVC